MEQEVVIKVEGLSKKFAKNLKRSMLYGTADMVRSFLGRPAAKSDLRKSEFWALDDVNFELKKGETLGIIGVNGSGKSTLLRLLNGIFPPDKGKIAIKGEIGALIAVGAGFHPHMTGRENIYLNGTILGMTRKEIDAKFDSIVNFAEIGDFLDAPVSTYSSGMNVRLGFAIAIHGEPDILLVDEILSVGDLSFRNKSLRYMAEFRKKANAIIFISHNLEQVRTLCSRVIIMDKGKIVFDGPTHEGCVRYEEMTRALRLASMNKELNNDQSLNYKDRQRSEDQVLVTEMGVSDSTGVKNDSFPVRSEFNIFCNFDVMSPIGVLYFSVSVVDEQNRNCIWVMSNDADKAKFEQVTTGKHRLNVKIPYPNLMPGVYYVNVGIRNGDTAETYERIHRGSPFKIMTDGKLLERGVVVVDEQWSLEQD